MLKFGSMISNQSQSSNPGLPTNGGLVLKYFLSETIHNGSRGTHFAKFLISKFLKGLTYSPLLYVNEVILGKKRSRSPKAHNLSIILKILFSSSVSFLHKLRPCWIFVYLVPHLLMVAVASSWFWTVRCTPAILQVEIGTYVKFESGILRTGNDQHLVLKL